MSKAHSQTPTVVIYDEPQSYSTPIMSNTAEYTQAQQVHPLTNWQRAKRGGKSGLDAAWGWADEKLGKPINKATNKVGCEAFWPTSLDKESDKAARILQSFCKDGYYTKQASTDGPKQKAKVLVKIPQRVIQNACGLAIFSTARTGWGVSGSGGSGVLIARLPDGSWSPPSGLLIHTIGVGFNAGIDIYDCVLVINTPKALEAFKRLRVTLGGEISVTAGPVGVGGVLERNVDIKNDRDQKSIFVYMKSKGLYAGVQIDGTFMVERNDENAKFYGERIPARDILAGKVQNAPASIKGLMDALRGAEGKAPFEQYTCEDERYRDQEFDENLPEYTEPHKTGQASGSTHLEVPRDEKKEPYAVL